MKRKSKQIIGITLCTALALSFAGCREKAESDKQTLSWFVVNQDMPQDGINPIMKAAEEKTGVLLKSNVSKNTSDSTQALSLMMSSGKLSDVITIQRKDAELYGKSGALVALDTLIDKHAPNFKKFLEENPDVKKEITCVDGHIYYIPFMYDTEAMKVSMGWFIRKDWLKKLGLSEPQNVDELYNVLKAFVEKDPNGNGKKDEVGYFCRLSNPNSLTALWGASNGYYIENGKVKFGPMQPEFKEAYKNMAKWFKEGLIDKELYTRSNARDVLLSSDQGGCTVDWIGSTSQYNDKLGGNISGFNFSSILPPANTKGIRYSLDSREKVYGVGWSMSVQNNQKEKTMEFFDFWFTPEGKRLANFGIEGKQYDLKDGKPIFKDSILNSSIAVLDELHKVGVQWNDMGYMQDFDYERQWLTKDAAETMSNYQQNVTFKTAYPNLSFTEEESDRLSVIDGNIDSRLLEITQQWLLGQVDVESSYDTLIKELNDMGMSESVKIHETAYERYLKN